MSDRGGWVLGRRIFLAALGLCFAVAFASFWWQLEGLVGDRGILPAGERMRLARAAGLSFADFPTLAWISANDATLHACCAAGIVAAALLVLDRLPAAAIAVAWICYLSLSTVSDPFLGYQWDALLLETAVVALAVAPRGRPSRIGLVALRFLLFELMFLSGVVKVRADPVWRDLSALAYHHWTQPLPLATAHALHHLPAWFGRLSVVLVLWVELLFPFLVFGRRELRQLACGAIVLLMIGVGVSGNYGFFNPLALTLCIALLDDAFLARLVPPRLRRRLGRRAEPPPGPAGARAGRVAARAGAAALAALWLAIAAPLTWARLAPGASIPRPLAPVVEAIRPFRSVNGYGLFANMTETRPEIVIEGSRDGREWRAYDFRWKPDRLDERPCLAAPHMPRLDWQMWFAALGGYGDGREWFLRFARRLLEGEPAVLDLLAENPFPGEPPRYLRATRYLYEPTSPGELAESGDFWRREVQGPFTPVLALEGGELFAVAPPAPGAGRR